MNAGRSSVSAFMDKCCSSIQLQASWAPDIRAIRCRWTTNISMTWNAPSGPSRIPFNRKLSAAPFPASTTALATGRCVIAHRSNTGSTGRRSTRHSVRRDRPAVATVEPLTVPVRVEVRRKWQTLMPEGPSPDDIPVAGRRPFEQWLHESSLSWTSEARMWLPTRDGTIPAPEYPQPKTMSGDDPRYPNMGSPSRDLSMGPHQVPSMATSASAG